jgi:hypothetical protein
VIQIETLYAAGADSIERSMCNAGQPSWYEGLLRIVLPPFSARAWLTLIDPKRTSGQLFRFTAQRDFAHYRVHPARWLDSLSVFGRLLLNDSGAMV